MRTSRLRGWLVRAAVLGAAGAAVLGVGNVASAVTQSVHASQASYAMESTSDSSAVDLGADASGDVVTQQSVDWG